MMRIDLPTTGDWRRPEYLTRDEDGVWNKWCENHNDFPSDIGALDLDVARMVEATYQHFAKPLAGLIGK